MKPFYRISALMMMLLILSVTFISCSQNVSEKNNTVNETTAAEETEDGYIYDSLDPADYEGYEFRILSGHWDPRTAGEYLTFTEGITGSLINDELYRSKLYVEDRFGVTITLNKMNSSSNLYDTVKTSILSNNDDFDLVAGQDLPMMDLSREGLFYNLYDIEEFDFSQPWWPSGPIESLSVNNKLYAASNYMSYCGLHWTRAILFNKDYAEDYMIDIEGLYDTVRAGEWYFDTLLELIYDTSDDLNNNNIMDANDQYGFATGDQCWYCMQDAMDITTYVKDEDNVPYLTMDNERVVEYLDMMTLLIKDSEDYIYDGGFAVNVFSEGRAMFAYTQIGDAYDYYRMTDVRYGFLPTPKLDEQQENYINACTDLPWAIPITVSDPSLVGTICEAMSCYNYNKVIPTYFDIVMKVRLAETENDAEMLQIIADTRTLGFAYAYQLTFNNLVADTILADRAFASYFAENELSAEANLEKLFDDFNKIEE